MAAPAPPGRTRRNVAGRRTGVAAPDCDGDGLDLAAVAAGTARREAVFSQFAHGARAIHTAVAERWKYAWSAGDGREFLFDRLADPRETRSRAGLPQCRDELRRMRALTISELKRQGVADACDGDAWIRHPLHQMPADADEGLLVQDPPGFHLDLPGYAP